MTMHCFYLPDATRPGRLQAGTLPVPEPGAGEVLVRIRAVSLNPVDVKMMNYGHPAWQYPHVPGVDGAGEIVAWGEGVTGWRVGERVMWHGNLARPGTFAEFTVVPSLVLTPLPEGVTEVSAAALPCAGMTAYQALHRKLNVRAGQRILILGGAGGVGGFAVQLARRAGLEVYATCSSGNAEYVQSLGAHATIDYHTAAVPEEIQRLTEGRGVQAIFDTVGPRASGPALAALKTNGQLAYIAGAPPAALWQQQDRALSLHPLALGICYRTGDHEEQADLATMGGVLLQELAAGRLHDHVGQVLHISALTTGLEAVASGHTRGKIVCQW